MKKYLIIGCLLIFGIVGAKAQSYGLAIGVRGGLPGGLSAKQMMNGGVYGLEAIVGFDYERNLNIGGLFEYQFYINRSTNWYLGAGGAMIFGEKNVGAGVDFVAGIEWTFDNYPLNLAFDWKPRYVIFDQKLAWYQSAVSIRYTL